MVNKYYQKHKERFQKKAGERYQSVSQEEKLKLLECMKKYCLTHKKQLVCHFKHSKEIRFVLRMNP